MTEKPDAAVIEQLRKEAERKYRRKMGVLARRLGWSKPKLSKILSNDQVAKLPEVMMLATVLGVPLSQLLRATGA